MSKHQGGCHCGKIAFEFEGGPITEGLECNCSICTQKGSLLHFLPAAGFTLKTPRADVSTYRFNKHVIAHHFCAACGTAPFAEANAPDGAPMVAINLRSVEGIDLGAIKRNFYNGRDI
jgi:hypothetical protein